MIDAALPVTALKGVGPRLAERLQRLGIHHVHDLLFHPPLRYQDRTRVVPIGGLRPGDEAVVQGRVELSDLQRGRRAMWLVRISDGSGALTLRFFHFSAAMRATLARGATVRCFGEVRRGAAALEMVHPEFRLVDPEAPVPVEAALTPIYPTTEGLSQQSLRNLTEQALALCSDGTIPDWLPTPLLAPLGLPPLAEALRFVHRPPPEVERARLQAGAYPAQQRLVFEELLAHHLSLRILRARAHRHQAPVLRGDGALRTALQQRLPFALTAAQQRVIAELASDLQRDHPMQRMVQGDVGCGKTVVAVHAVLQAVEAGYQAVVMAPTELLAEQHRDNFQLWLTPLGLEVAWLSGRVKGRRREAALAQLASGTARVAVGTHALFQDDVRFHALGLVIIDEQHRFGVHQRLALREKGCHQGRYPHQLIMTATPIPRSLAMTAYADLDLSVIDELPPGRTPVETVALPDSRRDEVVERVRAACGGGRQAYWVCTLIEESEALQCQAAEQTAALLAEQLPELRVALVHGRLKASEKAARMAAFKAGDCDLLVATTVIAVGVDVPNASLMIIENPERLGLAQLHQLRGRVGRGSRASVCLLMYHSPLSENARARLAVLRESNDGFEIARRDLELRGPGELLGTRQTGLQQLRIADLVRDRDWLPQVAQAADGLLRDHPASARALIRRWVPGEIYGDV